MKLVCSMHIEQLLVPVVYVSANVFGQDLITEHSVPLNDFILPLCKP